MTRARILLVAASALMASPTIALSRSGGSYSPPAGQLAATAPGGTIGLAGPRNVSEAIESGHAIGPPPGRAPARRARPWTPNGTVQPSR